MIYSTHYYLWLYGIRHIVKNHSDSKRWNHCHHYMGYSFLAQWVHHEGSIWWPITPWVEAFTTELHFAPTPQNGAWWYCTLRLFWHLTVMFWQSCKFQTKGNCGGTTYDIINTEYSLSSEILMVLRRDKTRFFLWLRHQLLTQAYETSLRKITVTIPSVFTENTEIVTQVI